MQAELTFDGVDVAILGINEAGFESANDLMVQGRALPWLQDTTETDVWHGWGIDYRDVVVLDSMGAHVFTFNLTARDLNDEAEYNDLITQLRDATAAP